MSQDKYEIVKMARVQAVAEWQGSADGGKSWRRIDKPRGESIESRVAYLRNMTNSQGRPIYLIRALYTTPQPAAQEPTSAVPVVEPVAWSHGCNALCANIDLWIGSCPHCGKPRPAAPVPQEPTSAVPVVEQLVEALKDAQRAFSPAIHVGVSSAIAAGQQYLKENGK